MFYLLADSISFAQLHFSCTVEKAKIRNRQRPDPVSNRVIEDMAAKFQPPMAENKWEMYSVTLDSDSNEEQSL